MFVHKAIQEVELMSVFADGTILSYCTGRSNDYCKCNWSFSQ